MERVERVDVNGIRISVLSQLNLQVPKQISNGYGGYYYPSVKLPSHVNGIFDTLLVGGGIGYKVLVLSSKEAQQFKPTQRPHRIFIWCYYCRKWVPAGRLMQHRKGKKEQW